MSFRDKKLMNNMEEKPAANVKKTELEKEKKKEKKNKKNKLPEILDIKDFPQKIMLKSSIGKGEGLTEQEKKEKEWEESAASKQAKLNASLSSSFFTFTPFQRTLPKTSMLKEMLLKEDGSICNPLEMQCAPYALMILPIALWASIFSQTSPRPSTPIATSYDELLTLQEALLLSMILYVRSFSTRHLPLNILMIGHTYRFLITYTHGVFVNNGSTRIIHQFLVVISLYQLMKLNFKGTILDTNVSKIVAATVAFVVYISLWAGAVEVRSPHTIGVMFQVLPIIDTLGVLSFFITCMYQACELPILVMYSVYAFVGTYYWLFFLNVIPNHEFTSTRSVMDFQPSFVKEVSIAAALFLSLLVISSIISSTTIKITKHFKLIEMEEFEEEEDEKKKMIEKPEVNNEKLYYAALK